MLYIHKFKFLFVFFALSLKSISLIHASSSSNDLEALARNTAVTAGVTVVVATVIKDQYVMPFISDGKEGWPKTRRWFNQRLGRTVESSPTMAVEEIFSSQTNAIFKKVLLDLCKALEAEKNPVTKEPSWVKSPIIDRYMQETSHLLGFQYQADGFSISIYKKAVGVGDNPDVKTYSLHPDLGAKAVEVSTIDNLSNLDLSKVANFKNQQFELPGQAALSHLEKTQVECIFRGLKRSEDQFSAQGSFKTEGLYDYFFSSLPSFPITKGMLNKFMKLQSCSPTNAEMLMNLESSLLEIVFPWNTSQRTKMHVLVEKKLQQIPSQQLHPVNQPNNPSPSSSRRSISGPEFHSDVSSVI